MQVNYLPEAHKELVKRWGRADVTISFTPLWGLSGNPGKGPLGHFEILFSEMNTLFCQ